MRPTTSRRGKAWTVRDRYHNEVYLTWERWEHIVTRHPPVEPFFEELRETVQKGRRTQDVWVPNKYFYVRAFSNLPIESNVIVVVVFHDVHTGDYFVMTAYLEWIASKG